MKENLIYDSIIHSDTEKIKKMLIPCDRLYGCETISKRYLNSIENIQKFLYFRFIPGEKLKINNKVIKASKKPDIIGKDESELIELGMRSLERGFRSKLSKYPDDVEHIVPISGGVDSRLILGFLLDNVDNSRIVTMTFGTPGTLDYDIGKKVAESYGLTHHAIDMRPDNFNWSHNKLIKLAQEFSRPKGLFGTRYGLKHFLNQYTDDPDDDIVWSGYLAGVMGGVHLPVKESRTWAQAKKFFIDRFSTNPHLVPKDVDPIDFLPDEPEFDRNLISYEEQLDFGLRQPYSIKLSTAPYDNFETPFINEPWLDFIQNVPREHRLYKSLYKKIAYHMYPEFFSIGVKNHSGLSVTFDPFIAKYYELFLKGIQLIKNSIGQQIPCYRTNFIDWDIELRRSEKLVELVKDELQDLENRNVVPWLDPVDMLRRHLYGENLGTDISLLTSLELCMKSEDT